MAKRFSKKYGNKGRAFNYLQSSPFGLQLDESSSLVSLLFREAFSHPYISFFHLLVNGFSVTVVIILGCIGSAVTLVIWYWF